MADDDERLVKIAEALIERTEQGSAGWSHIGGEAYQSEAGRHVLQVESLDGDGAAPFKLSLRNAEGPELESIRSSSPLLSRQNEVLERLYQVARREALGVDDAIAQVEKTLGLSS